MAATGTDDVAQHNAIAWLTLTDNELIERSASLGLPGDLHPGLPDGGLPPGGRPATAQQVAQARKAADEHAISHAGKKFVAAWIKTNRNPEPPVVEPTPKV